MELKEKISALVNENLASDKHFLVDINISAGNGPKKVLILIDGDEGINIDDCAAISRAVGHTIEEDEIIVDPYRLEVSSPGVDHPITMLRQYVKNIGRTVKITLKDGSQLIGELITATEKEVTIEQTVKKAKEKATVAMSDIDKTEIQIKF